MGVGFRNDVKNFKYFPEPDDPEYGSIEVFITLTDGSLYILDMMTPKFLSESINRREQIFQEPDFPAIFVPKITPEIIKKVVQSFIDTEEGMYWLKLYHILPSLELEDIDAILNRERQQNIDTSDNE